MSLVMRALDIAMDFLESKGMTRYEAAQKIVNYILLNYLGTRKNSERS